jgi:hypothetical protein
METYFAGFFFMYRQGNGRFDEFEHASDGNGIGPGSNLNVHGITFHDS